MASWNLLLLLFLCWCSTEPSSLLHSERKGGKLIRMQKLTLFLPQTNFQKDKVDSWMNLSRCLHHSVLRQSFHSILHSATWTQSSHQEPSRVHIWTPVCQISRSTDPPPFLETGHSLSCFHSHLRTLWMAFPTNVKTINTEQNCKSALRCWLNEQIDNSELVFAKPWNSLAVFVSFCETTVFGDTYSYIATCIRVFFSFWKKSFAVRKDRNAYQNCHHLHRFALQCKGLGGVAVFLQIKQFQTRMFVAWWRTPFSNLFSTQRHLYTPSQKQNARHTWIQKEMFYHSFCSDFTLTKLLSLKFKMSSVRLTLSPSSPKTMYPDWPFVGTYGSGFFVWILR